MIAALIAVPVIALAAILQSAIASRLPLLQGTTDLVLLIIIAWGLQERVRTAWIWALVGGISMMMMSAVPPLVPFSGYLAVTAFARLLQRQIWKTPVLAMFGLTIFGTLLMHLLTYIALTFSGTELPLLQSLELITLPSLLLNLLLAIPIYTLVKDLAAGLYPIKFET